jgi:hypothetical protein
VIVKYAGAQKATGGDAIITQAGNTIHIFFNSGTFTVGSTWKDLCGNYDATITGGSGTFSSMNGGVFVPSSGGNRATVSGINLASGTHTVVAAARHYGSTFGRLISSVNNNWLLGYWGSTSNGHYAEGWVYYPTESGDTNWRILVSTGNSVTDNWKLYINGALIADNNAGSQGPNGFQFGGYAGANEYSDGQVGFVMAYNRVLSVDEIQQNFAALRGRYGL